MNKKITFILILAWATLLGAITPDSLATKTKKAVSAAANKVERFLDKPGNILPVAYYVSETSLMVGAMAYHTNLFDNQTKTIDVFLYSPSTEITTVQLEVYDYPFGNDWFGRIFTQYLRFNEVRTYVPGNDSPDYQVKFDAEGNPTPETYRGYNVLEGKWYGGEVEVSKHIGIHQLGMQFEYNHITSTNHSYMAEALIGKWIIDTTHNDLDPLFGFYSETSLKKNLNLIAHDKDNDWDYYKAGLDVRGYYSLNPKLTFGGRFYTIATGGKKVIDEERTAYYQAYGNDTKVYSYAAFFDKAGLGSFDTMRGYYMYRYSDNHMATLQADMRYRITRRFQLNFFAETGRVMQDYDPDLLVKDLRFSYGAGFRLFLSGAIVLRGDVGISREGSQIRINFGQAF